MATVLLYNITSEDKLQTVRKILARVGAQERAVSPDELSHPLGYLAGLDGFEPAESDDCAPFTDEMLVMCSFGKLQFDLFLNMLKKEGVRIPLKAVLTQTNSGWSSLRLYEQIKSEHEAMTSRKKQEHTHRKKK